MGFRRIAKYCCQTNGYSIFLKNRSVSYVPHYCSYATSPRSNEENPSNHVREQIGLLYTMPEDVKNKLFAHGGLPKHFKANCETFNETCIMIREPALEIIEYLKKTNFKRPAVRYVMYGKSGCGKSMSLLHILHYAYVNKFFLLHVPWVWDWFQNNRTDVTSSPLQSELYDLPVISANWLKHFQSQNSELLDENNILTSKDYVWNQREITPAGSNLSELVIHGINRIKYAGGCIAAIVNELKLAASQDKCKVLVTLDGINSLFGMESNYKTEDKVKVVPTMLTLTHTFFEATKQDWTNAAIVVTVDQRAGKKGDLTSHYPLYLLGKKGFEHLNPFIGVKIPDYSDVELHSMLDYFEEKKWIQRKGARHELAFLSQNNPYELMNLCNSL